MGERAIRTDREHPQKDDDDDVDVAHGPPETSFPLLVVEVARITSFIRKLLQKKKTGRNSKIIISAVSSNLIF